MDIILSTSDDSLRAALDSELTAAGHRVQMWEAGDEMPAAVELAIIDGLEGVVMSYDVPCHILAIVDESELTLFPECPREVTDFAIRPLRAGEIVARVGLIASMPSWQQQTHNRLLAVAVEAAGDIIELANPDAVLEYVNPAYEETLGYTLAEVRGKTPAQLVRSDAHPPEFFDAVDQTLARGDAWNGTLVSRAKDGRLVHLDTTITPLSNSKGDITHHMSVKRDITERLARQEALIEANRALEQARDAAVAASRAKSEFLANMSHELRTPLNAIIGYSEMLMEDFEDAPQVRKDLQRIRTAGTHLLSLINDVLDISKIEADKVELSPEEFVVADVLDVVSSTIQPMVTKNDNAFEIVCDPAISSMVADRTRLRQVLLNLLSNACKFTKSGKVTLEVSPVMRGIQFVVRDTGIGIAKEKQAKLFRPFVQADSSTTREFGGTGLGLVICKRLTEMMGGRISLESEPGVGTTFTVWLPGQLEESGMAEARRGGAEPTVLLIDDDSGVRDLFTRTLSKRGFRVQVASTGPQGIELAGRLRPDVIVLDVKMPGMSGWEVLSALKLSEVTADIPVIMLTVMHQEEVGKALGAVDYLVKPIDPKLLSTTLRRHLPHEAARVLVVEDDEPTRELIRRTLESVGIEVDEAENGQEALEQLAAQAPDIIVLDLMMPVMDGFTFLHKLRASEEHADLPVIVATARVLSDSERHELAETAQRVIEKRGHSLGELIHLISDQIDSMIDVHGNR